MAFRTWSRLLLTALGVSLLAGAGQLGLAYGFGILRLTGTFTGVTVNQWPAQLVWVGWCAANAAVVGAVLTERVARRDGALTGTGRQLAVAAAAALGATVVAPLCMQPARAAELISVDPVWAVGICAVLGAVVGAGAALAVLLKPPVGWNMAAVAGVLWLLALLSAVPSFSATGALPLVRLGVFEPAWLDADAAQRLAMLVLPTMALLAGAATGALARWRGHPPLVAGATGVAGPVLVAFAYLAAGPGDAVDRYQLAPYYGALLAVAAGALGSAAAALARRPSGGSAAAPQAIEPTDILRPLPAGPPLPGARPAETGADRTDPTDRTDLAAEPGDAEVAGADLATTPGPGTVGTMPTAAAAGRTTPAHWDWPAAGATGFPPRSPGDGPHTAAGLTADRAGSAGAPAPAPRPAHPVEPARAGTHEQQTVAPTAVSTTPNAFPAPPAEPADPGAAPGALSSTPTRADAAPARDATTTASAGAVSGTAAAPSAGAVVPPEPVPTDDAAEQPGGTGRSRKGRSSRSTTASAAGRSSRRATTAEEPAAAESTDEATGAATPAEPAARPRRTRKSKATAKRADPTNPTADPATTGGPSAPTSARDSASTDPASSGTSTGSTPGGASTGAASASGTASTGSTRGRASTGAASTGPGASDASTGPVSGKASVSPAASGRGSAGRAAPAGASTGPVPGGASTGPVPAAEAAGTADPATSGSDAGRTRVTGIEPAPTAAWASAAEPPTGTADPAAAPPLPTAGDAPVAGKRREGTREPARPVLKPVPAPATPTADRPAAPRSTWPVAPAWSAPARPTPAARDEAAGPAVPEETSGHRPRHRAPLPDLERAASWEALATARRAGPTAPAEAAPSGPADGEDAPTGGAAAGAGEQNGGRLRGRLGLFRRNRARTTDEGGSGEAEAEPLAAQDEEYVDWVAGLGRPLADNEPEQESGRRSLRSSGRHHRD